MGTCWVWKEEGRGAMKSDAIFHGKMVSIPRNWSTMFSPTEIMNSLGGSGEGLVSTRRHSLGVGYRQRRKADRDSAASS